MKGGLLWRGGVRCVMKGETVMEGWVGVGCVMEGWVGVGCVIVGWGG